MPDGTIWNGLRRLRKDNTGYALRHLMVGAEGTLGFITAAALRLFPLPREEAVALCAVADEAVDLFSNLAVRRDDDRPPGRRPGIARRASAVGAGQPLLTGSRSA
jgi:FAD/FMN-containing dehydrogenase